MSKNTNTQPNRNGRSTTKMPETEVVARPKRRRFKAAYKLRILDEADRCTRPGELGALLRREGLYSSNLTTWRRQRERGHLQDQPPAQEMAKLRRENHRLRQQLERAEAVIDVQKNHRVALAPPVCVETLPAVSCGVSEDSGRRFFGGIAPVKKHGPWTAGELEIGDAPVRSRLGK